MKQPVFLKIIKPMPAKFTGGKCTGRKPGVSKNFRKIQELALDTGTRDPSRGSDRVVLALASSLVTICSRLSPTQSSWMISDCLWSCCHSLKSQSVGRRPLTGRVLVRCPRSPDGTYLLLSSFQRESPDILDSPKKEGHPKMTNVCYSILT